MHYWDWITCNFTDAKTRIKGGIQIGDHAIKIVSFTDDTINEPKNQKNQQTVRKLKSKFQDLELKRFALLDHP